MIGPAEPRAFGVKRFMLVAVPATASLMRKVSGLKLVVVLRIGDGRLQRLGHETRALARDDGQHRLRLQGGQALDLAHDFAHLLRGHRDIFGDCENFHKYYLASAFAVCAPCFLNVRVSENSPSLWPTMFSVTNTGLKILPLWTLNVRPTNSGVIVERRDQVLIGVF